MKIMITIFLLIVLTRQEDIAVGGVFDLSDSESADLQYGFLYAINMINDNVTILPNDRLVPYLGQDDCSSETGTIGLLGILQESNHSLIGVVGPYCSVTAEVMLFVSDIYYIPVVSPSATSPSLSNTDLYPRFARTVNSDLELSNVWLQLVLHFEMKNVNVLYSSELVHSKTAINFISLCEEQGITVQSQSFVGSINHTFDSEIENMKNTGISNFFLAAYSSDVKNVFRSASDFGITGYGYHWFGNDAWAFEQISENDEIVREAIQGSIVVIPTSRFPGYDTWLENLQTDFPSSVGNSRTPYAFDSLLTFALALHQVIEVDGIPLEITKEFKDHLFSKILESDFDSVTGNVKFNEFGDRTNLPYEILNFQPSGLNSVGIFENGTITIDQNISWPGNYINDGGSLPPNVVRFSTSIPFSGGWPVGSILFPALRFAVDEINANTDLIPNYYLDYTLIDSECSGLTSLARFMDAFDESGRSFLFHVGGGCSVASQPLAQMTAIWSMPMISYGSTSPSLSDKSTYPFFKRTVSPDTFQGIAWYYFIKEMNWGKVATINSNEDLHSLLVREFTSISGEDDTVEILTQEVFPGGNPGNLSTQLTNIKSKGARIILLACYEDDAILILNEAKQLEMTGENGYVWIGTDSWSTSTLAQSVMDDWQGIIGFTPSLGDNEIADSLWETLFTDATYAYPLTTRYPYSETIYDAVYAFAHSLHEILEVEKQTFLPDDELRMDLFLKLNSTDFEGANGRIKFNEDGDRIVSYDVVNLQGSEYVVVGILDPTSKSMTYSDDFGILWGTGLDEIPSDSPIRTTAKLDEILVIVLFTFSILGLTGTIIFLVILIIQRKNPVFIAARVIFCGILLACGFMAYSGVILLNYVNSVTCWIQPWLVHLPLILAMSCILSKAWRVYVIFIKNKKKLKIVKIRDRRLLIWIGGFMGFAVVYLTVCMLLNPYVPTTILNEANPEEQFIICKIEDPTYSFWPILLIFVEAMLVFTGVVLAYLTRRVELLNYNESSFITICVYNLFFTGCILVPLTYLIPDEQINAQFAILSAGVLLNITVLIFYFFVTRIIFIIKGRDDTNGVSAGTSGSRIRVIKTETK